MASIFYAASLALVIGNSNDYWNGYWWLDMVLHIKFTWAMVKKKPLTGISDFREKVMSVCKGNILLIIVAQICV